MSDNNNVENDNESDYVYLKRPYLFNIRYNSRQVWNKRQMRKKLRMLIMKNIMRNAGL